MAAELIFVFGLLLFLFWDKIGDLFTWGVER